jgi:hypothetical protein
MFANLRQFLSDFKVKYICNTFDDSRASNSYAPTRTSKSEKYIPNFTCYMKWYNQLI